MQFHPCTSNETHAGFSAVFERLFVVSEDPDRIAALLQPTTAGEVKVGQWILLKGKTCRIVEVSHSKTGKHGFMKARLTGLDIFTGGKCMNIFPGHHRLHQVLVNKLEYHVVGIPENRDHTSYVVEVLSHETAEFTELQCPLGLWGELRKAFSTLPFNEDLVVVVTQAVEGEGGQRLVEQLTEYKHVAQV